MEIRTLEKATEIAAAPQAFIDKMVRDFWDTVKEFEKAKNALENAPKNMGEEERFELEFSLEYYSNKLAAFAGMDASGYYN